MIYIIKSIKVQLQPNNKQKTLLHKSCDIKRFAYNWCLQKQEENHKNGGKFLNDGILRKEFTQLKKQQGFEWLNEVSCDIPKQAIKDCCIAYKRFFNGVSRHPQYKKKKDMHQSFYQDSFKIQITDKKVYLSNIGWVRLREWNKLPIGKGKTKEISVVRPTVSFDGLNWWVSMGVEFQVDNQNKETSEPLGIDLGIKDLAIISNNIHIKNVNKTEKVKKLKKRLKREQRALSRKYESMKKGKITEYSRNFEKNKLEIRKLHKRLEHIRDNHIHQFTNYIVKLNPQYVVIEDLNIKGMMKNRHLSKAIQEQKLYETIIQIVYKCSWNDIELRQVNRFYPSSKLCHECGSIKKDLKLSDRIYICPDCGSVIDRDYNASINLRDALEYKIITC